MKAQVEVQVTHGRVLFHAAVPIFPRKCTSDPPGGNYHYKAGPREEGPLSRV